MLVLNHLNFYLTSELELTIVGYSKLFLRYRYRKMVTFIVTCRYLFCQCRGYFVMIIKRSQCIFMMKLLVLHTIQLLTSQHCLMVGGDLLPTFLTYLKTGSTKQHAECTTIRLHYVLINSIPVRCSVISSFQSFPLLL